MIDNDDLRGKPNDFGFDDSDDLSIQKTKRIEKDDNEWVDPADLVKKAKKKARKQNKDNERGE